MPVILTGVALEVDLSQEVHVFRTTEQEWLGEMQNDCGLMHMSATADKHLNTKHTKVTTNTNESTPWLPAVA